ncbi:hypothetical protein COU24_02170 [Candidatus Kuenenbacteria bacterium CG10_big_fil_rev_8_21_14_0_10_39_14]|nr:MAG: hypothetical protein COU24_02170 [Candidatus Kuenenbacteria bacterium CG10_big_fil_rev_8_21_14_0_10_39_14]PIX92342.1 MAG: hypothetical protein COZ26_02300 [Candidatus Kuenenbacteria bacterium CG_4_10_14_3_um_filter_39_14]
MPPEDVDTEAYSKKDKPNSPPLGKGLGPHQGFDDDLMPDVREEDLWYEIKDNHKFIPADQIPDSTDEFSEDAILERIDRERQNGSDDDEFESNFEVCYAVAEENAKSIKNPLLKEIAAHIIADAKKLETSDRSKSRKINYSVNFAENGDTQNNKRIETAHAWQKQKHQKTVDHFNNYFRELNRSEIQKMPFSQIEFLFNKVYQDLAALASIHDNLDYFKKEFFPDEQQKEIKREAVEKEAKTWREIERKHGFGLKQIQGLTPYFVDSLSDYLELQNEVDSTFTLMAAEKRLKGDDDEYKRLKAEWQKGKDQLKTFRMKEDLDPRKIKVVNSPPEFIRKYNLGVLTSDHRQFLFQILKEKKHQNDIWAKMNKQRSDKLKNKAAA